MVTQLSHGRGQLADAAAASLHRVDAHIGHPLQITEAGRPMWLQQQYWDEYQAYLNGGPWAPIAAFPSDEAPHIRNGGEAFDTNERNTPVLNEHGWFHTVFRDGELVEPWHYEYQWWRDQHRNDPAPAAPSALPETEGDSDMRVILWAGHVFTVARHFIKHETNPQQAAAQAWIWNPRHTVGKSGFIEVSDQDFNGTQKSLALPWDAVAAVLQGRAYNLDGTRGNGTGEEGKIWSIEFDARTDRAVIGARAAATFDEVKKIAAAVKKTVG